MNFNELIFYLKIKISVTSILKISIAETEVWFSDARHFWDVLSDGCKLHQAYISDSYSIFLGLTED